MVMGPVGGSGGAGTTAALATTPGTASGSRTAQLDEAKAAAAGRLRAVEAVAGQIAAKKAQAEQEMRTLDAQVEARKAQYDQWTAEQQTDISTRRQGLGQVQAQLAQMQGENADPAATARAGLTPHATGGKVMPAFAGGGAAYKEQYLSEQAKLQQRAGMVGRPAYAPDGRVIGTWRMVNGQWSLEAPGQPVGVQGTQAQAVAATNAGAPGGTTWTSPETGWRRAENGAWENFSTVPPAPPPPAGGLTAQQTANLANLYGPGGAQSAGTSAVAGAPPPSPPPAPPKNPGYSPAMWEWMQTHPEMSVMPTPANITDPTFSQRSLERAGVLPPVPPVALAPTMTAAQRKMQEEDDAARANVAGMPRFAAGGDVPMPPMPPMPPGKQATAVVGEEDITGSGNRLEILVSPEAVEQGLVTYAMSATAAPLPPGTLIFPTTNTPKLRTLAQKELQPQEGDPAVKKGKAFVAGPPMPPPRVPVKKAG